MIHCKFSRGRTAGNHHGGASMEYVQYPFIPSRQYRADVHPGLSGAVTVNVHQEKNDEKK